MSSKIGGITVDLTAEIAKFRADMKSAAGEVKGFAGEISDSLHKLDEFNKAIVEFLAVREVINFLKAAAVASQQWAKELAAFQQIAGVSSKQAAALAASARLAGVDSQVVTAAFAKLGLVLEKTPEKFAELGIKVRDAHGQLLPFPQILSNTLQGLNQFKPGADRAAAAALLAGKGAEAWIVELLKLQPLLKSSTFADTTALVVGLGLATDNARAKEEEWTRTTGLLKLEFLGFQNQLGEALLPALKSVAASIEVYARNGDLKRWAEETAQSVVVLTLGLVKLADFVAEHNDLIGAALAAGGALAIQSGTLKGIAAGVAAVGAAWVITGTKGDAAAAAAHKDLQRIAADLKAAQSQIGKPIQTEPGETAGTKSFVDVDQLAKAQKKFEELRNELLLSTAAQKAALAVADQDASTRRATTGAIEVQNAVLKFQNEAFALGTRATKAQTDAIAKYKTEELATKNVVQDVTKATEALRNLRDETAGVNNQIRVAQLNHGLSVQEIDDRRKLQAQLDADLAIQKELFPLTEAQADQRRKAILELDQTRTSLEDINAANQVFAQTRDPFEIYTASLDKLNQQLRQGLIDQETFSRAAQQAEATFTGVATNMDLLKDAGKQAGDALAQAFKSAIQPGNDAIATAKNLLKSLEDIALELLIIKPLERGFNSYLGGGGFNLGIGGTPAAPASVPGHATGGSFLVTGNGGIDTNLVQFRASRGERVTIDPVGGRMPRFDIDQSANRRAGTTPIINMTVVSNDANSFRSSRDQIIGDLHRAQRGMGRYA